MDSKAPASPIPEHPSIPSSAVPEASATLQRSLEMGGTLGAFLSKLTGATLSPGERHRLEHDVRATSARLAYAGLSLWAVASLVSDSQTPRRALEAVAGVSLGLLGSIEAEGFAPGTN